MSEIKLKIVASSGEDLRNQLTALLGAVNVSSTAATVMAKAVETVQETPVETEVKKTRSTRTSTKTEDPEKEKAKEALQELIEEKAAEETSDGETFTKEQIIAEIKATGAANKENVKAIIKSYGYEDIYGFKDSEKAEFIAKVRALKED